MSTLVKSLKPIFSRVRTDVIALKKPGEPPVWTSLKLTAPLLTKHLNGGPYVGCAPILAGADSTLIAVLDLDSHKGETPWPEMIRIALDICGLLYMLDYEPIAFRSTGGQGIHIYLLFDTPQDAYSVRMFLAEVLGSCGLRNGTKGIKHAEAETFPKQDSVPAGGHGNMFVLPLAGASEPLEFMLDLEPMGKDYALTMPWPVSPSVRKLQKPIREIKPVSENDTSRKDLQKALAAIPNEGEHEQDYDAWRNVIFALHHATDGDDDGLALAHEFSARSSKYDPEFLDNRVWPYARSRDGGITERTLMAMAREHGYVEDVADDFEVIEPGKQLVDLTEGGADDEQLLPNFVRNGRGEILPTIDNVCLALAAPWVIGWYLGFDQFRDGLMWTLDKSRLDGWRPFGDSDYVTLRRRLEREIGFKPIGRELMRDAVLHVAELHQFDSAQLWLGSLRWDGVPRIGNFLHTHFGAEDTPYTRAVSVYWWTAMAGRVCQPGIQADMAPVLISVQGRRKSTGLSALVPDGYFAEIDLSLSDGDLARMLRGKLLVELPEMKGLGGRGMEHTKALFTRKREEWVPKYREFATQYLRRAVLCGTTNVDEFLVDDTGNRRMLPVRISLGDLKAIVRDRWQLWAEAHEQFLASGIAWEDAHTLAEAVHPEHMETDAWQETISEWLDGFDLGDEDERISRSAKPLRMSTIMSEALGIRTGDSTRVKELRVGRILRTLGYERSVTRFFGPLAKAWMKKDTEAIPEK